MTRKWQLGSYASQVFARFNSITLATRLTTRIQPGVQRGCELGCHLSVHLQEAAQGNCSHGLRGGAHGWSAAAAAKVPVPECYISSAHQEYGYDLSLLGRGHLCLVLSGAHRLCHDLFPSADHGAHSSWNPFGPLQELLEA